MRGFYWPSENLSASEEGLCCVELVNDVLEVIITVWNIKNALYNIQNALYNIQPVTLIRIACESCSVFFVSLCLLCCVLQSYFSAEMHKFLGRGRSVDWRVSGGALCFWAMFYVGSCQSLRCYSVDNRWINMEQLWYYIGGGETEVLGDNLRYCYFVQHKSCMDWSGIEPGPLRWQAGNWRCLEVLWCPTKVNIALRKWLREEIIILCLKVWKLRRISKPSAPSALLCRWLSKLVCRGNIEYFLVQYIQLYSVWKISVVYEVACQVVGKLPC
jgi:hypothetical protein